ncbi:hypothetical protein [Dermatobacter hominis]|uniref:hypothetical protein n=1 Tax=Dermatobacter hominis TaxID=2884263 RepID=UPI001D1293D8|nr:hypothetical protein [Dermatobacter hominis]UDY37525.1 hypothetical protein LH044_08285 [Dermatobacter hominis]
MAAAKRAKDDAAGRGDRSDSSATVEALHLITAMRADVEALVIYLDAEERAAKGRGLSPKRLARLRLVSDDLRSAHGFVAKSVKG